MGGRSSHLFPNPDLPGQDEFAIEFFRNKLLLGTHEVKNMHKVYCEIDRDMSGFIRDDEFYSYFKLQNCALSAAIFSMLDFENTKFLNFFEFVCAVGFKLSDLYLLFLGTTQFFL